MAVLSEDPLGTSVTEAKLAAAAVGGRLEDGGDEAGGTPKKRSGRRKVAKLECQCCFSEHDVGGMVSCRSGALKKYHELQYEAAIECAGMGDVSKCPECHFIAIADPMVPPLLFHCPQRHFKSCKECGEEYHPQIACDQVESKTEARGRTKVEETMTTALLRTCPRPFCWKKFLKSDGCNKITCTCGCLLCHVCRKEIPPSVGYKHFSLHDAAAEEALARPSSSVDAVASPQDDDLEASDQEGAEASSPTPSPA
ncbi:hypothetical protein ACHAWF_012929 [Thalassiosira exigua]